MAPATHTRRKPAITLTRSDHERLTRLAESFVSRNASLADQLLDELERARIVDDNKLRADVVRMGSTLRFTTDAGEDRTVTLVFPDEADIAEGRVSILTPVGIALVGLSSGQSIDWTARDGRNRRLTVESVEPSGSGAATTPRPDFQVA
ncbi:MAG: nucleoside diphosphate kinase regulator [Rhizobiales bacterium 65-79]|jgi:regulator of nucleoside diphosphate kinase|nr:nucleoside diphosphate kinase regulator [Hyphomicrobiales bacterium]OJU02125.1 MAG: nucleoside diphosphate kinase regulator [Rhizobiales bacterium 65-79]